VVIVLLFLIAQFSKLRGDTQSPAIHSLLHVRLFMTGSSSDCHYDIFTFSYFRLQRRSCSAQVFGFEVPET